MKKILCIISVFVLLATIGCNNAASKEKQARLIREHINQMAERYPENFYRKNDEVEISLLDQTNYYFDPSSTYQGVWTPYYDIMQRVATQLKNQHIPYYINRQKPEQGDLWEVCWEDSLYIPKIF